MFTGYEAFALMAAIILLGHGIPQAKVVSILRDVRSDLEAVHGETLQKDRKELFDPQATKARARNALLAVDNTAPVFFGVCETRYRQRTGSRGYFSLSRPRRARKVFQGLHGSWLRRHALRILPPDVHPGG